MIDTMQTLALDEQRRADQHEIFMLLDGFKVHDHSCKPFPSGRAYAGEALLTVPDGPDPCGRIEEAIQWGLLGALPDDPVVMHVAPECNHTRVWYIAMYPDEPELPDLLPY